MREGKVGTIPLVFGVTGHRNLRPGDLDGLKQIVSGIFNDFRSRYPSTPFLVLSQLAEGADRLVASAALEAGINLIVPLPMPVSEYETDFEKPESKEEFRRLLALAQQVFELHPAQGSLEGIESAEARDRHYANAGIYISRHAHVLIALWDGVDSKLTGGTSDVVRFKLEGIPEMYLERLLDPAESGPVYHVVTPRLTNPDPPGAFSLHKLYPKHFKTRAEAEKAFDQIFRHTDRFNRDGIRHSSRLDETQKKAEANLIPEEFKEALSPNARFLLKCYALADSLAGYFQKWTMDSFVGFYLFSFGAFFFYEVYPRAVPSKLYQLKFYLASLILALAVYVLGKRTDCENKYLDYRALAEGLRVQFFWQIAGLPRSAADHYLQKQRSELDWIRNAIRACSIAPVPDTGIRLPFSQRMELLMQRWLNDQRTYYSRATGRDKKRSVFLKIITTLFLALGAILALVKIIFFSEPEPGSLFLIALILTSSIGAILNGFSEKLALSEQTKQYGRMGSLFLFAEQSLRNLLASGKNSKAEVLIEELGKEALAENGDWVILHRERKLELPKVK